MMIFSLFSLLLEKNILTYKGETIFHTDIVSFQKNLVAYKQSFREVDKDAKEFFLKRLIEKKYLEPFQIKFTDQIFQEQLSYRAQSIGMSEQKFLETIQASGMNVEDFKNLLAWQFYHQHFVRSFENKVDVSSKKTSEENYYEFSRFELDQKEEQNKALFKNAVNNLIREGHLVQYKSFSAVTTPYAIPESSLEDSMQASLKSLNSGAISQVFTIGDKWVVLYLKSKKKKKLSDEESYRKNVLEKSYSLSSAYVTQEMQLYKLHENN